MAVACLQWKNLARSGALLKRAPSVRFAPLSVIDFRWAHAGSLTECSMGERHTIWASGFGGRVMAATAAAATGADGAASGTDVAAGLGQVLEGPKDKDRPEGKRDAA